MLHGQMLQRQMLHGQMVLGQLSTVKDGATNLKWVYGTLPWRGGDKAEINAESVQLCWSQDLAWQK